MYTAAEVKLSLESEPLAQALLKLQLYAQLYQNIELASWAMNERDGYKGDEEISSYRQINIHWIDHNERRLPLRFGNPEADLAMHHTTMVFGVGVLETWSKPYYLFDPVQMRTALENLNPGIKIAGARFEHESISAMLNQIRIEATLRFSKTLSRGAIPKVMYPLPEFTRITSDLDYQGVLASRWHEANNTLNAGAPVATVVLLGSILEGCLLAAVQAHPAEAGRAPAAPKNGQGKAKPFNDWQFEELINVAHSLKWITQDVKDFSGVVRDYRNLIHPRQQVSMGFAPTESTARITWEAVSGAIQQLIEALSNSAAPKED